MGRSGQLALSLLFLAWHHRICGRPVDRHLDGRIVQTSEKEGKSASSYQVQYAFTLDSQEFTRDVYVNADVFAKLKAGDPVSVRALPWTTAGHWPRIPATSRSRVLLLA
jgi:hypothetical protein